MDVIKHMAVEQRRRGWRPPCRCSASRPHTATTSIDLPFPEIQYGVEIDSPRHLLADVASADRTRDRALKRRGWEIDRFYWFELDERPTWFVQEVTRRLAQRRTAVK